MHLKKDNIPFTMVANEVLYNKNLSFKAKGMYAYLFSKPDEWDFSSNRMTLETTDRRDAIMGMLRELEKEGYLLRKRLPNGKMEYTLKFSTLDLSRETQLGDKKPKSDFPYVGKSLRGESRPISNTEDTSNTEEKVILNSKAVALQKEIPLIIESFIKVNKACSDFYGNITQRKYTEKLITTYGFDLVSKVVTMLPQFNSTLYNKATTPKELWDKWAKIEAEAKSLKERGSNKYQINKIY